MERFLMTHSLLSSWLYAMKDSPYSDATNEKDPMEEFLTVLRREPTETTEAMRNGNEFEQLVSDILGGTADPEHKWYFAARKAANIVRGGLAQYKAKTETDIRGMRILLYGRLDWLKAGVIYDTKFSKGYERGKYFDSTQHPMYFALIPEATEFEYVVSNGTDVWTERYRRDEAIDIRGVVADFLGWLDANGFMDLYKEKWVAA